MSARSRGERSHVTLPILHVRVLDLIGCGSVRLQEARLEVLKQLLKQREEHHHELNVKRLDRIWYSTKT